MSNERTTSVRDEYLQKFLEDKLEIPCDCIRLTQLTEDDQKVYEAPGTLKLGKSFGLKCTFDVPTPGSSMADIFTQASSRWERTELGQIVPASEYFKLDARTSDGVQWTCDHVFVTANPDQDVSSVSFEASYAENISRAEHLAYAARLTYIEQIRLPKNRRVDEKGSDGRRFIGMDGSEGRIGNLDLTYVHRFREEPIARSELSVHAVDGYTPPRHFNVRVEETVQFCTALLARPICTEVAHGTLRSILLAKHRPALAGIASPPIQGHFAEQDFYKLATAYYEHACKDGDLELMSQISRNVGGLFDMGSASLASMVLQLCVAVEAMVQTGDLKKLVTASAQQRKVAQDVKTGVLNMPGLDALSKRFAAANDGPDKRTLEARLEALLGGLFSGGRTEDVLKLLEGAGAVAPEEIKAWKDLRHASAHGSWRPHEEHIQVHFDDLYKVMTLVYRLVFVHIGYQGKFSKRSTRGWPTVTFDGSGVRALLEPG